MDNRWDGVPADLFVNILQRLPPCPRRRLRLVCRHWRNVIDDRMPERPPRAKILAFINRNVRSKNAAPVFARVDERCHAFVFDELPKARAGGRYLNLRGGVGNSGSSMVGTCNGLLCLRRRHGDVVVANPATGEKVAVPPPPSTDDSYTSAASYSFVYHPATGLYKVVQVPCADGGAFYAVNVFTLGDVSWREVPVPCGSSWLLSFGLVSIHGAVYWVSKDGCSVMSFDLGDERLAFVATLPVRVREGTDISSHLTADVRGRLGLAVCSYDQKEGKCKSEVWMLEGEGGRQTKGTWVLQCKVEEPGRNPLLQQVASPHAIHGEHVLVTTGATERLVSLHAHRLSEAKTHGGMVPMKCTTSPWIGQYYNNVIRTFAYVETKEPLALYAYDDGEIGEDEDWNWVLDSREKRWKLVPQSWYSYLHIN
ncbi:unnamed protein product [Urochloa humidicola]